MVVPDDLRTFLQPVVPWRWSMGAQTCCWEHVWAVNWKPLPSGLGIFSLCKFRCCAVCPGAWGEMLLSLLEGLALLTGSSAQCRRNTSSYSNKLLFPMLTASCIFFLLYFVRDNHPLQKESCWELRLPCSWCGSECDLLCLFSVTLPGFEAQHMSTWSFTGEMYLCLKYREFFDAS